MGRSGFLILLVLFFSLTLLEISKDGLSNYSSLLEAQEEKEILDFNIASYTKEGRSWELKGRSADIFEDTVKLKDLEANFYETEKITLTSKEGTFDRRNNLIHLEKDVKLVTETGLNLETDSLNYDVTQKMMRSLDSVNIQRENLSLKGNSLEAKPDLRLAEIKKDIVLEIERPNPEERKIQITCDGPLEINYEERVAVFTNNVKVETAEGEIASDTMEVYFDILETKDIGSWKIDRIKAIGNVRITREKNISFSQEAVYLTKEKKITLIGKPKLVIYSEEGISLP